MRKALYIVLLAGLGIATLAVGRVETARAMPPFKKVFDTKYVKPDGDEKQKAFAASVKKHNCNVCHKGKTKKMRNAYGEALDKLIEKTEKDPKKIEEALNKVAEQKSKPDDATSPTFGELIEQGQLPAGIPSEEPTAAEEADLN